MKKTIFLIVIAIVFASGFKSIQLTSLVKTDRGMVQGTTEDGLIVFKGIPFAAPPVADLRWKAPQPAAKWDGVLKLISLLPDPYREEILLQERVRIVCT